MACNSPKKQKIISLELNESIDTLLIDFDGNGKEDYIVSTNGKTGKKEFWINDKEQVVFTDSNIPTFHYKWFYNLDSDSIKEVVFAKGYEDGIDYFVSDLDMANKTIVPLFYFNPIIENNKKYYWGYPWDINSLKLQDKKILSSFQNPIERDDSFSIAEGQKVLPLIFFTGKRSDYEIESDSIKNNYLSLKDICTLSKEESPKTKKTNDGFIEIIPKSTITHNFRFSNQKINDAKGYPKIYSLEIFTFNKKTNKSTKLTFYPKYWLDTVLPTKGKNYFIPDSNSIHINNGIEFYDKFIIADFNFDKLEDFALINYEGSNAGPQYSYFIQKGDGKFEIDNNLSNKMRFFPIEMNYKEKSLTVSHPMGCCQVSTYKLQLQANGEWTEIFAQISDME